ncbi:MAG: hypothetical protein K6F55_04475 [Eubacterium sp.]|nr:hypothetical protein [Eubacterium sp.]
MDRTYKIYNISTTIASMTEDVAYNLNKQIPLIREYLDTDIEALYVEAPAAESKDAIIIAYPGLFAIAVQRYSNVLYLLEVPILPRVMTELAHSKTGTDINPGAPFRFFLTGILGYDNIFINTN